MVSREWPLVVFTLLAQVGVGIFLMFVLPLALSRQGFAGGDTGPVLLRALLIVFILLTAAAAFSFFHLGNPRNAYRTLSNLKDSWLSREIFSELIFVGTLALLIGLEWGDRGDRSIRSWLYILGGSAGAVLVLSMANIYRLEAVPAWDRASTPVSFVLTALAAGSVGALALPATGVFGIVGAPLPFPGALKACALVFPGLDLAAAFFFDPTFGIRKISSPPSPPGQNTFYRTLFTFRLALLILAVAVLALAGGGKSIFAPGIGAILAFGAVLASEGIGRTLFYASFRKAGV